jgi:hypothetical protein
MSAIAEYFRGISGIMMNASPSPSATKDAINRRCRRTDITVWAATFW